MNLTLILLSDVRWAEAYTVRLRSTRMFCGRISCKARRTLADLREHGTVCITFGCIFGAIFNEVVRMCTHQQSHDVAVQTETAYLLFCARHFARRSSLFRFVLPRSPVRSAAMRWELGWVGSFVLWRISVIFAAVVANLFGTLYPKPRSPGRWRNLAKNVKILKIIFLRPSEVAQR